MATDKSTAFQSDNDRPEPACEYVFKPFAYGRSEVDHAALPGGTVQRFANLVEAIAMGSQSIMELIEWDVMREDDHETDPECPPPVLNNFHRGTLMRMVRANMGVLCGEAESIKTWAFEQHTPEGKAEALADAMRTVQHHERLAKGLRS